MPHIPVGLVVLAAVIALVVLLMQTRLRVFIDVENGFHFRAFFGPVRIPVGQPRGRPPKARADEEKKEAKKPALPNKPLDELVELALQLVTKFLRGIRFEKLHLHLVLAGEDPATVARLYGYACVLQGLVTPVLLRARDLKTHLDVDFEGDKTAFALSAILSVKLGTLLALGLYAGWRYVRIPTDRPAAENAPLRTAVKQSQ